MQEADFKHSKTERGQIQTRVRLPIEKSLESPFFAAADGQLGVIMRFYRDWQLSGSQMLFDEHWLTVRRAIAFCWIDHGWDADQDGVIEGCQHNTMDVEYLYSLHTQINMSLIPPQPVYTGGIYNLF